MGPVTDLRPCKHSFRGCCHSCLFSNLQIDLETIKEMYLEKYDVTLKDALGSECSGDFKRLLIGILH